MKLPALSYLLLALFLCACAHEKRAVTLGTIDTIHSNILNEQRNIWVYVPPGDNTDKQRYPVVYLLDGDDHFYSVVGMIQQLSSVNGNTICPKMIVVGIPNTDRTRDLTPTHVDVDPPFMDSASSATSGGGAHFASFIEKELIPYIDSMYPTAPYRMLIGHSFGGLAVMNILIHQPRSFNSYIAIDPSMWWDHQKLLQQAKQTFGAGRYDSITLFLGIANTMEKNMDTASVKNDTSSYSKHIRSILALNNYLHADTTNGLRFKSKYYKDDNHGSVPLIAEYDALHFIFDFYPLKLSYKEMMDVKTPLRQIIDTHYQVVSAHMGYPVKPPEDFVNDQGYEVLGLKQYAKAEDLFKMNMANYPESFSVYDAMGDLCVAKGDKQKAVDNFKKALSIKDNPDTQKKLQKLLP